MILFKRTVRMRNGKQMKAIEFSGKVTKYLNDTHGGSFRLLRNGPGNQRELHFMAEFESMGAMEAWTEKVNAEPGFQALLAEAIEEKYYDDVNDYIFTYII